MSKKKNRSGAQASGKGQAAKAAPSKTSPSGPKKSLTLVWIIAGVLLIGGIVGAMLLAKPAGSTGGTAGVDPQEAKYIGRLLPAGYEEPKLADIVVYTESTPNTVVTAEDAGETITLSVNDITEKRNVIADYTRADGKTLPVIAFLKPSGKLFVGISFCPPCEGERQTIASDGTLTCDSCGTKRTLETGVGISGACKLYPLDELPVTVEDGKVVIEKSLIEGWTAQPLDRPVG